MQTPNVVLEVRRKEERTQTYITKCLFQPQQLLVHGVEKGHKKWVDIALSSGANPKLELSKDYPITSRGSLLALAALKGHYHLVPVLLDAGVHVDDGGRCGYTPLQVAVHYGHDKVVDALMKAEPEPPNVNAQDKDGKIENIFLISHFVNFLSVDENIAWFL